MCICHGLLLPLRTDMCVELKHTTPPQGKRPGRTAAVLPSRPGTSKVGLMAHGLCMRVGGLVCGMSCSLRSWLVWDFRRSRLTLRLLTSHRGNGVSSMRAGHHFSPSHRSETDTQCVTEPNWDPTASITKSGDCRLSNTAQDTTSFSGTLTCSRGQGNPPMTGSISYTSTGTSSDRPHRLQRRRLRDGNEDQRHPNRRVRLNALCGAADKRPPAPSDHGRARPFTVLLRSFCSSPGAMNQSPVGAQG